MNINYDSLEMVDQDRLLAEAINNEDQPGSVDGDFFDQEQNAIDAVPYHSIASIHQNE